MEKRVGAFQRLIGVTKAITAALFLGGGVSSSVAAITGKAFRDTNVDGQVTPGEAGVDGVLV